VSTVSQASPVEIMQLANEAAFISGVAGTMISMTLLVRFFCFSCAPVFMHTALASSACLRSITGMTSPLHRLMIYFACDKSSG
jgi:hypothetical protein